MTASGSACASCGTTLRQSAKFCDECAAPVAGVHEPAEFKQVTVLFADVVRSMDVAAALGAERFREIMSELFQRSAAVVRRYGGTVNSFTGDGIMALFGAPTPDRRSCGPGLPCGIGTPSTGNAPLCGGGAR
jgi:adenylate cyclase